MIYLLKSIQTLFDFVIVILAFAASYFFRLSLPLILEWKNTLIHSDYPIGDFLSNSAITWVFIIIIFIYQWRYSIDRPYKNAVNNLTAAILWVTIFILIYFYNREIFFSRLIPLYAAWLLFILLLLNNYIFSKLYSLNIVKKKYWKKTLIIWANQNAKNLIQSLRKSNSIRQIVWILDAYWSKLKEIDWVKILWKMNKFEKIINDHNIEEIIQADNLEQTLNIVTFCENKGISYYLMPSLSSWIFHENMEVLYFDKSPTIYLNQSNLDSWNLVIKRIIDCIISMILLPIFLFFSFLQIIRRRKILIKEKRVVNWKTFSMFRYSVNNKNYWEDRLANDDFENNSKNNFQQKLENHQVSMSLIDKILIKTSLLELPQILNVIMWDMSFVWPRPPFSKEYNNYKDYYKKRLTIKPWITWLWQIRKNKHCYDFQSMYRTDLEYINKWSFYLDIKIIFFTIFKILRK